jgi:ribonuclease P protein component
MLKKKERLNRADFNRFFSSGKRTHHQFFTVIFSPYSAFHASVVVSKKTASKATARNTLRRRVYAVLRDFAHKSGLRGVYIVLLKPAAVKASRKALREALREFLSRMEEAR